MHPPTIKHGRVIGEGYCCYYSGLFRAVCVGGIMEINLHNFT